MVAKAASLLYSGLEEAYGHVVQPLQSRGFAANRVHQEAASTPRGEGRLTSAVATEQVLVLALAASDM